jgi:hypothetical protein
MLGLRKHKYALQQKVQKITEMREKENTSARGVVDFISFIDNICMEDVDSEFSIIIYFDKKPYARLVLAEQCKIFTFHRHIEFPLTVNGAIAYFSLAQENRARRRGKRLLRLSNRQISV